VRGIPFIYYGEEIGMEQHTEMLLKNGLDAQAKKYDWIPNILIKGLRFSNGIQLSKNEDYLMISESGLSRVLKYYLKGSKKGQHDVLVDGLPGSPDNIRPNGKGGAYVSLIVPKYSTTPNAVDALGPFPLVRKFILRLLTIVRLPFAGIEAIFPNEYTAKTLYYIGHLEPFAVLIPKHSIIVELDEDGKIIGSLHSTNGEVAHISEITLDNESKFAYLGSPYNTQIWKVNVEDLNTCTKKTVELNISPDVVNEL